MRCKPPRPTANRATGWPYNPVVVGHPDYRETLEVAALPDDNPKTRFGATKPPMQLIPGPALAHIATAFRDGAEKYGPYNWRDKAVSSSIYVAAAMRHIELWFNREENAQDSGVHHLGHAAACLSILMDAQETNMLNDDRPKAMDMQSLLDRLTTKIVA